MELVEFYTEIDRKKWFYQRLDNVLAMDESTRVQLKMNRTVLGVYRIVVNEHSQNPLEIRDFSLVGWKEGIIEFSAKGCGDIIVGEVSIQWS